jgi:DNA repair exonuclease SbcCD ATPase subunit
MAEYYPPQESKMSANMLKIVSELKNQVAALEAMIGAASGALKKSKEDKPKEDKPKKPLPAGMKAWQEFNKRLRDLLKANDTGFKLESELKQFASKLKKEKAVADWTDEEILVARESWTEDHAPACPVCEEDVTEEPTAHHECLRTFATQFVAEGKGTEDEGLAEWKKLSGMAPAAPVTEKKKAGRPKMTDEQKAAARAAKAAMTDDEKAAAKAAREAKKAATPTKKTTPVAPDAPVKAPKVAWGGDVVVSEFMEELESVTSVN